jgi:hypothetical protein
MIPTGEKYNGEAAYGRDDAEESTQGQRREEVGFIGHDLGRRSYRQTRGEEQTPACEEGL